MKKTLLLSTLLALLSVTHSLAQEELWGMTSQGGANGAGLIFKTSADGTGLAVQMEFPVTNPGQNPQGELIQASNGKWYGMTRYGGAKGIGTLFEFDPTSGMLTKKADFTGTANGRNPTGGLVSGGNGKLYGMTLQGGVNDFGTLFEFDPVIGTLTKKIDFAGATNGNGPSGTLALGGNGKLYGSTQQGGVNNMGTLIEFDPISGTLIKKFDFTGAANGSYPMESLTSGGNGKLYGMASGGGANDLGTLFEFDIAGAGTFTKKIDFNGPSNGSYPYGSLIVGNNGKLYGMTREGGTSNSGTIFEFDPAGAGTLIKKINFTGANGSYPMGSLTAGGNGKLYGMTPDGGTNSLGTLFEFDPGGAGTLTKKIDFNGKGTGSEPLGSLAIGSNGKLYGMTNKGGVSDLGTLFEFDLTGTLIKKIDFNETVNGGYPYGNLIESANGKFYGMTLYGGINNFGTLFEFDPAAKTLTKKTDFNGAVNGRGSLGSLTVSNDGKLYGMTQQGGANDFGTLFEFDPSTGILTKKVDFNGGVNGNYPQGNLFASSNGKMYGMTAEGGANDSGTLFEFNPTTGLLSKKIDFNGAANGRNPTGTLTVSNGKLYGMTQQGGSNDMGTVFEFDPTSGTLTKKIDFNGAANGSRPSGSMVASSNGKLYGMTNGGANNAGTVFEFVPSSGTLTKKIDFDGSSNGSRPWGSLTASSNGKLYGMTHEGGANDLGIIFEFDPTTEVLTKRDDFNGANGSNPYGDLMFVAKSYQNITFNAPADKTVGDAPFVLTATSSSGLAVSFSTTTPAKVTTAGSQVTLVSAGRATIIATQPGNANFNAATPVERSFCIRPAKPTITVTNANTETPTLTSSAVAGNQWFLNGTAIQNGTNTTQNAITPGVYKLQVKVDDCLSEFSNDQAIIVTGDIEINNASIEVYPNPVSDWLTVSLGADGAKKEVALFDLNGKKTDSQNTSASEAKFHVAGYASGVYFVKVKAGGAVRVMRFVKE
jgi:uncharacterized repeat protein (TIGR03803 family)